jgi:hypothetical protein
LMAIAMQQYNTAKHHHRVSTRSNSIIWTIQRRLFLLFHREKGLKLTCWQSDSDNGEKRWSRCGNGGAAAVTAAVAVVGGGP